MSRHFPLLSVMFSVIMPMAELMCCWVGSLSKNVGTARHRLEDAHSSHSCLAFHHCEDWCLLVMLT